ncbi:hypothetical protein CRYUN_Cryun12cG0021100 [Craigia yunnanensis]
MDGFSVYSVQQMYIKTLYTRYDVKEPFSGDAEGGGFYVGRNEPEEEYESEECEAGEPKQEDYHDAIKDDLRHDRKEFMHTVLQDEDEVEFEPEEKDRDSDSGVEYIRNTVRRMEYYADEIEGNEVDVLLYNKIGRMVDVHDECCHEVVNRSDKKSNLELFVGDLDKNATEDDIKKVFSKVGEVVNIKLMMNPLTNKNRGFAFLHYATMEQANRALTDLKKPVVNGKQCQLEPCMQSNTLYLGNICKHWTQQKAKKLKSFGVEELKDLRLARDISNARINRGFAFLEFSSHSDAMSICMRLQKQDVVFGVDRSAKVCFAYPHVDLRDQIVAKVTRVFLGGIPPSWDDRDIRELVNKFGKIEKIELARYKPSAKRKDYGFVTFYGHDAAVACAEAINNAEFGKGHHKVKIKATLSQPFTKWEWKHQICGNFHPAERLGSGALRYSTDIPTSSSAISMQETRELKPSKQSSSSGHKRELGYRDKYPFMPKSRSPRPLPPPERSYKRKSPVSIYPKRSMKKDYAGQDDLPPRKRHASDCGSRVGKSHERGYPFEGHGRSIDSCRGLSYSQKRRECGYETCSHSSHCEADAYDHNSYYGSKRQHSTLENIPLTYANSRHRGSRAHSGYKIYESDSQYSNVYGNDHQYVDLYENDSPYVDVYYSSFCTLLGRPQRSHPGYTLSSRYPGPESQRGCCIYQESIYGNRSFGAADDRMYSLSSGRDYMSPVQGSSKASIFSRLGPGSSRHSEG